MSFELSAAAIWSGGLDDCLFRLGSLSELGGAYEGTRPCVPFGIPSQGPSATGKGGILGLGSI